MVKKSKQAISKYADKIPSGKHARIDQCHEKNINNAFEHKPVWQIQYIDFEHDTWGWKVLDVRKIQEILAKLKNYETMTWKEIHRDSKRNHVVSIDKLEKEARVRLQELQLDDLDELFRLRLNGKERVWGILENYIFKILWWDPEHTVCLSQKKNT